MWNSCNIVHLFCYMVHRLHSSNGYRPSVTFSTICYN